ncbi:DNA polymerase III subunit delta' [Orenia marismortui]|uniref:DNA polymerase III subunit delta' n=1 Tax=Orenia marismortui TaxID=46469 RepID=A0A4R8H7A2_9FIRM|nr:DNA polymerase III subunit delta' [Orenia marismortui]TDX51306.1 DNA polymerase III delta prime subunit [Orenia marismortui]
MPFDQILGQELAKRILKNALNSDRLSHAYLFTGEEGLGKYLTAFEFTKAINCQENIDDSCYSCISCRKADNHNHPDIKEIHPDGASIKIDQIRKLQQEILYKPYESNKKVYIIHQADKMSVQAANSLLKTLEEPPSYAVIILIASNLNQLLPTIISRCQIVRFRLVSDNMIKDKLVEEYNLIEEKAELLTSLSAGKYNLALDLINEEGKLEERNQVLELAQSLTDLDRNKVFDLVQKILDDRDKMGDNLDIILTWYRDLLMLKLDQSKELINVDYSQQLLEEAKGWERKGIEDIIKLIEETNNVIKNINVNLQLALEVMLLKLNKLRRKNYNGSSRSYI